MIKIDKDLEKVPPSLNSKLTNQRRQELIVAEKYISQDIYNSRYKMQDVKKALTAIYHKKCAFCESKSPYWHVEHFRPKSIYFWLAYSWDNLLYICPNCNTFKRESFECLGHRATFQNTEKELSNIHKLAEEYSESEESLMIHPELEDIEKELFFHKDGKMESQSQRMNNTIQTCRLNRPDLKEARKKVFDDLKKKLRLRFWAYKNEHSKNQESMKDVLKDFKAGAQNPETDFLAFRRFVIRQYFSTLNV